MIEYFSEGMVYLEQSLLISLPVFVILYILFWKKRQIPGWLLGVRYLFLLYLICVLRITRVISAYGWHPQFGQWNLIPFQDGITRQTLANILIFFPFGIFLPLSLPKKKWNWGKIVFCGFLFSVSIELIQLFFVGRLADIDDVITNTIGAALGGCIFLLMRSKLKEADATRCWLSFSYGLIQSAIVVMAIPMRWWRICLGDIFFSRILTLNATWSGNHGGNQSFSGIHYTLLYLMLIAAAVTIFYKDFWQQKFKVNIWYFGGTVLAVLGVILLLQLQLPYLQ